MVPFGGWEMPLSYPAGTLEEHRACREGAVAFDVSHLGTVRVEGQGALAALQGTLTNDLQKVTPGRAQYTHLLAADGSVLDDIIVWWIDDEAFDVMPNASNTDRVVGAITGAAPGRVDVRDTTAERAVIAVQGPQARQKLATVSESASSVGRFRVQEIIGTDARDENRQDDEAADEGQDRHSDQPPEQVPMQVKPIQHSLARLGRPTFQVKP